MFMEEISNDHESNLETSNYFTHSVFFIVLFAIQSSCTDFNISTIIKGLLLCHILYTISPILKYFIN